MLPFIQDKNLPCHPSALDTLACTAMTRKFFALAALLLFALPAFTQTPTSLPAQASADAPAPLKIGGDVLPPVLIFSVEPKIPHHLRVANTAGTVNVGSTIDRKGKPTNLHIVKSSDSDFDKISMDAVAKYRFKPATLHGEPVPVQLIVQVNFQVR